MNNLVNASSYKELAIFECGNEICVKSKAISLSKKPYHLFHYVVSGKGTLILNDKEYQIGRGMIFFIPRETDAIYYSDKDSPWCYEWVGFDGEVVDQYLEMLEIDIDHPIIVDTDRAYKRHFDSVVARYGTYGFIDIFGVGAFYKLFGEMIMKKMGNENLSSTTVTIQLAKDFIHNNYQFDISIIDIARNANVTPNYLSNIFQREEGISTKGYLIKIRMEKAMVFLQSGHFKIKEVSEMVGYSNQLHFSSQFRKYYGNPPTYYVKGEDIDDKKENE